MALDPNIPLSAAKQPGLGERVGEAYTLAGQMEKQQQMQTQRQDQEFIQEALKGGANFSTPQGLEAAIENLQGKLSPGATQTMMKGLQDLKANESEIRKNLASEQEHVLTARGKQMDFIAQNLQGPLSAFEAAQKGKGDQGALQDFETAKNQTLQSLSQQGVPPQMLQQFAAMDPMAMRRALDNTKYGQETLKGAWEIKRLKAQTESEAAQKEKYLAEAEAKRKGGGDLSDFSELTESQQNLAKNYATSKLITGKDAPARGRGYELQTVGMQALADEFNTSTAELMAAGADVKTRLQAKAQVEKRIQALDRASNQMAAEIPVMEDAMKGMDLPSIPIAARGKIIALRAMGDPSVTKLDQAADAVFKEFENVISGNPGALYVANMEDAKSKYKSVETPQQMREWIDGAKRIIANAKAANKKTREDTMGDIMEVLHFKKSEATTEKPSGAASKPKAGDFRHLWGD
jgi:hypothetical protein